MLLTRRHYNRGSSCAGDQFSTLRARLEILDAVQGMPDPDPPLARGLTRASSADHWDAAYRDRGPENVSWYAPTAGPALELIDRLGVSRTAHVLDVGGGASPLVDGLLDRGFHDLTVLDLSAVAVDLARRRLGDRADAVRWVQADLRTWRPSAPVDVWHDRAVLHFMVDPADQAAYRATLLDSTASGSLIILATFALDGPEQCSGLPVLRNDIAGLVDVMGPQFDVVEHSREDHLTPWGSVQPFTRAVFRRRSAASEPIDK